MLKQQSSFNSVTKTNASYENNVKKRQQERALLTSLQPLLSAKDVPSAGVAKRQKAADNSTAAASSSQNVVSRQARVE